MVWPTIQRLCARLQITEQTDAEFNSYTSLLQYMLRVQSKV